MTAAKVLSGRILVRSEQLKLLLRYLVEAAAQDEEAAFTEAAIATTVFQRRNFDARVDTIVRAQMLRLRRKLDQYYGDEGRHEALRIAFERNSYRPILRPNEASGEGDPARDASGGTVTGGIGRTAWKAAGLGAVAGGLLVALGYLVWISFAAQTGRRHPALTYRLWMDLAARPVTVVYPNFLFFRSYAGIERDFELNLSQDLPMAQSRLKRWPVVPQWDNWIPVTDVHSFLKLKAILTEAGQQTQFQSGRNLSLTDLQGRNTVILGAPRAVPAVAELLKPLPFHLPTVNPGTAWKGFRSESDEGDKAEVYDAHDRTELEEFHETWPDYALLTHIRREDGGQVWSIFGNRTQTGDFVVGKLLDPEFLRHLETEYLASSRTKYQTLQIVFRVEYINGVPQSVVPVSHRIR